MLFGCFCRSTPGGRLGRAAEEYSELAKEASSPFLRAYYLRIAEQYRMHEKDKLSVLESEGAAATARSRT
jgi:hypothetical protein